MKYSFLIAAVVVFGLVLHPGEGRAQLTAPGSVFSELTHYPSFTENDTLFIFCSDATLPGAALQVTTSLGGSKTFEWQQYNAATAVFDFYFTESSESNQSQISNLADGCYRVTIRQGAATQVYRAWVMNNFNEATAEISESNCDFFRLTGNVNPKRLVYRDLNTNAEVELSKNAQVAWKRGEATVAQVNTVTVNDPPTKDTDYTYEVSDRFGCYTSVKVTYVSIVTKAGFTVDPGKGEAPLQVRFTNISENGDPGRYEWFFYRSLDEIKKESQGNTQPVDSIQFTAFDDSPVYTYEASGAYKVKLVSKKVTEFYACTDTFYLKDYILVDTSFIVAPVAFSPNGDGTNDNFVVKYWSMKTIKISIFNRWGRTVHVWQSGDVRGFKDTWEESVWDGRIGGRWASPGVYFYVAEGLGRDGRKRFAHGFVHLFRGKD